MPVKPDDLRVALRHWATGVSVVTAEANGTPQGPERTSEGRRAFVASRTVLEILKKTGVLAARDEPVIEMLPGRIQACDDAP